MDTSETAYTAAWNRQDHATCTAIARALRTAPELPYGTRCVDGRLMRHDPQHDDPDMETDVGQCPNYDGDGGLCEYCKTAAFDRSAWPYEDDDQKDLDEEADACGVPGAELLRGK